jgi:hypothetical protein
MKAIVVVIVAASLGAGTLANAALIVGQKPFSPHSMKNQAEEAWLNSVHAYTSDTRLDRECRVKVRIKKYDGTTVMAQLDRCELHVK